MATHSSILAWRIHGQRSLAGYSPWGWKEPDMTEGLTLTLTVCQELHEGLSCLLKCWHRQGCCGEKQPRGAGWGWGRRRCLCMQTRLSILTLAPSEGKVKAPGRHHDDLVS